MSLSPLPDAAASRETYEVGWVAIHRMLREGKSWSGREEHCSFWNTGDGRFANASAVTGLDLPDDGRAAARVDWDLDGRNDLWIAGRNSPRVRLFLNRSTGEQRSVELLLRGVRCNKDAIGARVEVSLEGGRRLVQTLRAGEGYLAQSSKWMHFGLGTSKVGRVAVRWPGPDGAVEEFTGVEPGARFVLEQGGGAAKRWSAPAPAAKLATAPCPPKPSTERARIALAARAPLPPLPILTTEGESADAGTGVQPPMLIVVWATWCAPCVAELTALARAKPELDAAGISVLALSVDELPQRPAAIEMLERLQWEYHAGFATLESLEALDALQRTVLDRKRRTPLPSSFLVDPERKVAAIYKGALEIPVLLADAARLRSAPARVRDDAAPFGGRWMTDPPQRDLGALELAYAERGLEAAAAEAGRQRMVTKQESRASILNQMGVLRAGKGTQEDLEAAVATFREAVAAEPGFLDATVNLATALHQLRRIDEAIPIYQQALRIDSRNVSALYNLALARCALGHRDQARGELELLELLDRPTAAKLRQQMETVFGQ